MKVLILCTGNSCRSQMAHGIHKSLDSELSVFSAGTRPVEKVNFKAVAVMREIGIDISDHTPHNVAEYLKEPWDYVVTVCGGAKESCPMFTGNVRHRLHIGFDDPSDAEGSDEYVMSEFRRVRDEIRERFRLFNIEIQKGNN